MESKREVNNLSERLKIQERALSNLADALKKRETTETEDIRDIQSELKALKMFLSRVVPEFKKEFPEIQRKVK
jgi:GTP cyclohydrolase I